MWIPRNENVKADTLKNLGSTGDITKSNKSVVHLFHSTLDKRNNEVNSANLTWDLHNTFVNYLQNGMLPKDKKKHFINLKFEQPSTALSKENFIIGYSMVL